MGVYFAFLRNPKTYFLYLDFIKMYYIEKYMNGLLTQPNIPFPPPPSKKKVLESRILRERL